MKVTVTFEMDKPTAKLFGSSSIERVINSTLELIDPHYVGDERAFEELQQINYEDWCEWKPIAVTMTNCIRDALFRMNNPGHGEQQPYSLHVGTIGG